MASTLKRLLCHAIFLLIVCLNYKSSAHIRFTKLSCATYNASLSQFEYCHLKSLNRTVQELSLRVNLYDKPVDNVIITMQFMKKSNGYRKFMPDIKFDACVYLKKHNNVILNSLFKLWSNYSNMNHTCPYDHDLIISKMQVLDDSPLVWIPFPAGDYAFYGTFFIRNVRRFQMDFFFNVDQ